MALFSILEIFNKWFGILELMKLKEQQRARELRKQGFSVKEITRALQVAQSSVSVWARNIELNQQAKQRLLSRIKVGQFAAAETKKRRTEEKERRFAKNSRITISKIHFSEDEDKVICALLYWCEGAKNVKQGVNFINSDPKLLKKFIALLRKSFKIEEKRLKLKMHLHHYHNEKQQKEFWMKELGVSESYFGKTYQKPRGGSRYREGYPGCLAIKYHDSDIARQLVALAKAYLMYTI